MDKRAYRKKKIDRRNLSVFFFKFCIWISRLSFKKVENNSILFLTWPVEENLVVNNKDNRVLMWV